MKYLFDLNGQVRNWDEEFVLLLDNIFKNSKNLPKFTSEFFKIMPDIIA